MTDQQTEDRPEDLSLSRIALDALDALAADAGVDPSLDTVTPEEQARIMAVRLDAGVEATREQATAYLLRRAAAWAEVLADRIDSGANR